MARDTRACRQTLAYPCLVDAWLSRAASGGRVVALAILGACVEDLRFSADADRSTPALPTARSATAMPAEPPQPDAGPRDAPACDVDLALLLPPVAPTKSCDRPSSALFRHALCSCSDLKSPLPLTTDAFDSRLAPYAPGTRGGGVATNGRLASASALDIGGSVIASGRGPAQVFAGASSRVSDYMRLNAELSINTAELSVGRDLWVNGRILSLNGALHVGRQISQPNANDNVGEIAAGQGLRAEPVQVEPPCVCGDNSPLDFGRLAELFAAHSDNTEHDLPPAAQLTWRCGHFMFTGGTIAATRWDVADHVAVFIEGDLDLAAPLEIELAARAELDVFVHGSLRFASTAELSSTRPGAVRFYVSAADPILLPLGARLNCSLYAPNAQLRLRDQSELHGAFLVSELVTATALTVHYDAAAAASDGCSSSCEADSDCRPPWICEASQCVATH